MLVFLALETTCDETGAAVLEGPRPPARGVPRVLASVVASQVGLHERFGGVVPEIASRAHVRQIVPMIDEALRRREVNLGDLGMIAVATRPGLVGALVVGLTTAKTLALALDLPLVAVDHLEGHLYACQLAFPDREVYPCVGLVVSGGHTSLYACRGPLRCEFLGGTTDDAAGEAFDKVASLLGLGYPGGPEIERAARGGDPRAFAFPRSFLHDDRLIFSFSGLKTAVLYALRGPNESFGAVQPSTQMIADLAASFQEAVVDVLVAKTRQALCARNSSGWGWAEAWPRTRAFASESPAWPVTAAPSSSFRRLRSAPTTPPWPASRLRSWPLAMSPPLDIDVTAGLVRPGRLKRSGRNCLRPP